MQVVALLKVVLLGVAAAKAEDAIGVLKTAGVTQPVGSTGTVVKIFSRLAAVSLRSIYAVMS